MRLVPLLASLPCFMLALLALAACGGEDPSTTGGGGDSGPKGCDEVTNVSDGPTTDSIGENATSIVCYYASPLEGYCRWITDSDQIADFYASGKDKDAIGCGDAVVLTDADCPKKNAAGICTDTSLETERVYYICSKFSDPLGNCTSVQGSYVAF